jgi:S-adenosylmethionine hydrolase
MAVLTLTSDYGLKDHYVSALKGAIYRELPDPNIVDITHQIQAFNITEAAFMVRSAWHHFPAGSVHLILVNEEAQPNNPHLVMQQNDHYFIAADNGVLGMINPEKKPDKLIAIDFRNSPDLKTAKDIFTRAAAHILRGGSIDLLGRLVHDMKIAVVPKPIKRDNDTHLIGSVIYIDRFGNLVTNLHQREVTEVGKGRRLRINLPRGRKVDKILGHYYEEKTDGNLIAIFNASGLLEIALFRTSTDTFGGATDLLGMRLGDQVDIEFL